MRSVLLVVVIALCALFAPSLSTAAICAPLPNSSSSKPHAPKDELPREQREPCRVRHVVAPVDREKTEARVLGVRAATAPTSSTSSTPAFAQTAVDVGALWRTPPALQVFRN